MISAKKVSNTLGISTATFLNWQKEGLIPKTPNIDNDDTYRNYILNIKKNVGTKLSSRANRSMSTEKLIVYQGIKSESRKQLLLQLIEKFEDSELTIEEGVLSLIICQLTSENLLSTNWLLNQKTRIEVDCKKWLISITENNITSEKNINSLFSDFKVSNENDDILGAFYQSVQSISEKSTKGSFYTPTDLLEQINIESGKTIYDPCCGSGNILLNVISSKHNSSLVSASDIDETALKICETNLVLFFHNPEIKSKIFKKSFLQTTDIFCDKYDFIITNPPWGAKFSATEKKQLSSNYAFLKSTESFSICLYNAVQLLSDDGSLLFFLPKSFLNVKCHKGIRKIILNQKSSLSIKLLGNAFKGVVSEAILLEFNKSKFSNKINISSKDNTYKIEKSDCKTPDYFISVKADIQDCEIMEKIYSFPHTLLKNNADFALGIVTGNNEKFISQKKDKNQEAIFRGKNINPFMLTEPSEYIEFTPEKFQQAAPTKLYRTRKIVYRFISNKIICCISEQNELMLNSANIFIPKMDYPFETIVCLFNSTLYSFLYKKKFDSIKVLRSQIEELPLPNFTSSQHKELLSIYKKILSTKKIKDGISEIDSLLCSFLSISDKEFNHIKESIKEK